MSNNHKNYITFCQSFLLVCCSNLYAHVDSFNSIDISSATSACDAAECGGGGGKTHRLSYHAADRRETRG
jgi:hypothetical protein